jgi:hypothetical protein
MIPPASQTLIGKDLPSRTTLQAAEACRASGRRSIKVRLRGHENSVLEEGHGCFSRATNDTAFDGFTAEVRFFHPLNSVMRL